MPIEYPRVRLSSLRLGRYDDPPASSEASTPRTRRGRPHRGSQASSDLSRDQMSGRIGLDTPTSDPRMSGYLGPVIRRRQRSSSPHDDDDGPRSTSDDAEIDEGRRRRAKRRRVDQSPHPPTRQAIKYGYYGRVESGQLKLNLISCDGKEHLDPAHPTTSLGPENILRHDKSVYCSVEPDANIVLQHADDAPFCLEKLHIVGPEHGFTAPVREGLVYIAMTMRDLKKYIDPPPYARRQGIHTPPYRRYRDPRLRSSPERITFSDALRDPEVDAAFDERARDYDRDAEIPRDPATSGGGYYRNDFGFGRTDAEAHCEIPTSSDAPDAIFASDYSNGRPMTILSDEEPGPEENSSQEVLDYRLQRLRMMRRRFESENWDREDRLAGLSRLPPDNNDRERDRDRDSAGMGALNRLDALMARSRVHDSQSPSPTSPPFDRRDLAPQSYGHPDRRPSSRPAAEAVEQDFNDPNVTTARFYIKRGKHKVAIRFDPPVSGRFILLKVWAGRTNVDLQSVIAKGFGGGRFFPAAEFR